MKQTVSDPQDQFQAVEALLSRWLDERNTLLTHYTELAGLLDGSPAPACLQSHQADLCQVLVDYVSAGHFEVFHELLSEAEAFADGSGELAASIMPAIGDTTEVILAYDEKYGGEGGGGSRLRRDLSALGEMLESRFRLEDRLIAGLHNRHREVASTP